MLTNFYVQKEHCEDLSNYLKYLNRVCHIVGISTGTLFQLSLKIIIIIAHNFECECYAKEYFCKQISSN